MAAAVVVAVVDRNVIVENRMAMIHPQADPAVRRTRIVGFLLGAIAAATYGMNPLFAIPLYEDGMNADSVLLFRYIIALPILAAMLLFRGRNLRMSWKMVLPVTVMGVLLSVSSLALFLSYNYMNSGIASTLLFVYPIMVALIMAVVFKEKIGLRLTLCMLITSVGIALLYKGEDGAVLSVHGVICVMISALSYAIYIVAVNGPRFKSIPTLLLTFYILLFGSLLFVGRLVIFSELTLPMHWYYWGNLIGLALFPTAISFLCTTRAIQMIGSTPTAILGALEPVAAILFGVTILGQAITMRDMLGLVLIIVSVPAVIAGGQLTSVLMRIRKLFPKIPFNRDKKR